MGTTRDAIDGGSSSFVWVVAIEGWSELFTNHSSPAAVATAWSGTGWTTVKGGLFVDLSVEQSLNPDQPFTRGGTCNLWMMPQAAGAGDIFGVAVGRKTSPFETYLDETLDNLGVTITVKSTAGADSSGYVHIGTECIAYTGKTPTTFTGCTRGAFSPFGSYGDQYNGLTLKSFSHYHRVTLDAQSVQLKPVVSSLPRTWAGRWVGVWAHRVVGGVLDTKTEAELIYAGQIGETRDDENTGAVVLQLKAVQEVFAERLIGGSQWEGAATDGCYLDAGMTFRWEDNGGTVKTSDVLTVVATGAVGAYEINEGYWTLTNLCNSLSTWLAQVHSDGDLTGTYSISSPVPVPDGGVRTKIYWTLNTGAQLVGWGFVFPSIVMDFLGFEPTGTDAATGNPIVVVFSSPKSGQHYYQGSQPNRLAFETTGSTLSRVRLSTRSGTITDQYETLPALVQLASQGTMLSNGGIVGSWGVFQAGNDRYFAAEIHDNGDGTVELKNAIGVFGQRLPLFFVWDPGTPIVFEYNSSEDLVIRQVYVFEETPALLALKLAISTGGGVYNSPYFALPVGCGAAIPYEFVDLLEGSGSTIPGATGTIVPIIDKPITISALLSSDYVVRWSFFHWRDGSLQLGSWRTPSATLASATLSDSNKAEPSGHSVNQKSSTSETTEWLRPIVKLRYNRANTGKGDDYRSVLTIEDQVTADDQGGAAQAVTIELRNTYQDFSGTGASIDDCRDIFIANMALLSRPARKITRSIDSRQFLSVGVGSIVLVNDTYARDPETGLRGIIERPALVTRHQYNLGGATAGAESISPMGGQVDLFFTDTNPDRSGATYCPSADVAEGVTGFGFSAGYSSATLELACYAHRFSEANEAEDVENFEVGDKILIIERDPLDAAAPTKWERVVASTSVSASSLVGISSITLTAAISSPAWDATKRYHVISQDYAAAATAQHVHVYQADDATGLIAATAQPFLYGGGNGTSAYTANGTAEIELLASSRYADGAARDVAHEAALARLIDNLIDYKTALQLPMLCDEMSNTTITNYQLVAYFPVTISPELLSNDVFRYLTCALWARSTDGTPTKARVTLSREKPTFSTIEDVPWSGTFSQNEWTGITSTTPTTLADGVLTVNGKRPLDGHAWIAIELGLKCASRGLAKLIEGIRLTI